jgi:hypothetical protein
MSPFSLNIVFGIQRPTIASFSGYLATALELDVFSTRRLTIESKETREIAHPSERVNLGSLRLQHPTDYGKKKSNSPR